MTTESKRTPANDTGGTIPQATRAYIYRIVTALATIAVAKGWLTPDEAPLWLEVVAAVVGIGTPALAAVNTSTKR